jgi:hypothetical protein
LSLLAVLYGATGAIMKIKKLWINEDGNLMLYLYALVDAVSFTVFFLEDKQLINTHGE